MKDPGFILGARLAACGALVRDGSTMADIGTDHAYLPIWLVLSGKIPRAFASDIHEAPIQSAAAHIAAHGIGDKITTFTADGLAHIPPDEVDDIVIAGMGGDNIAAILAQAPWIQHARYRLILQPMSRSERLRAWLYQHHFAINREMPVCEAKRIYTVICAEYNPSVTLKDEFDCYAGQLPNDDPHGIALLQKQAGILRDMADGYAAQGKISEEEKYRQLADRLICYAEGGKR